MNRNVKRMQIVKYELHGSLCNEEHILMSGKKLYLNIQNAKKPKSQCPGFFVEMLPSRIWRPYGDSNPGYHRERAMS